VAVKNRAQEDIINQIPVKEAIEKERMYFAQHPVYSTMPDGYIGCDVLVQKLTRILFTHIKHNMPTMINECKDKMRENEQDLAELGPAMPTDQASKMQLIWQMVLEFLKTYEN